MPVLLDPGSVLQNPRGAHSLVLRLVHDLAMYVGEPVEHERLVWMADMASGEDYEGALQALRQELGVRPRRASLFVVLGDLVDQGLVRQEPEGLFVTQRGAEAAESAQAAGCPDFKSLLA